MNMKDVKNDLIDKCRFT